MVFDWSKMWGMKFHIDKTKFMSITRNKNVINYQYTIDDNHIARVTNFCDLGLEINSKLAWNYHISKCCGKANKKLGFITAFKSKKRFSGHCLCL